MNENNENGQRSLSVGIVLALLCLSIGAAIGATLPEVPAVSADPNWSTLHGFVYKNFVLGGDHGPGQDPSIAFPLMKSLGFNFVSIPVAWWDIDWYAGQTPDFFGKVDNIMKNADANGIYVSWVFSTGWKNSVFGAQAGTDTSGPTDQFMSEWYNNQITTPSGQNGWQYMMQDFWGPLIQHTTNHPSLLSYQLEDEPAQVSGVTLSTMQKYNTWFAQQIRALTPATIEFMYEYLNTNPSYTPSAITSVAPVGVSNLALDIHVYAVKGNPLAQDYQGIAPWIQAANSIGITNIHVGEFGPDTVTGRWSSDGNDSPNINTGLATLEADHPDAANYFNTMIKTWKQYGVAWTAWKWDDTVGDPICRGWLDYLDCGTQATDNGGPSPWWQTYLIADLSASIYGYTTNSSSISESSSTTTTPVEASSAASSVNISSPSVSTITAIITTDSTSTITTNIGGRSNTNSPPLNLTTILGAIGVVILVAIIILFAIGSRRRVISAC